MGSAVRVGVGVFVWKDGKFLIGKRGHSSTHGIDTWSLAGGKLDYGETWEQCAAREVLEETGMHIDNIRLLAVTNDIFASENKHFVTIWVESDWQSGKPVVTEPDKFICLEWRTFKTLPEPLFQPCWNNLKLAKPLLFDKI